MTLTYPPRLTSSTPTLNTQHYPTLNSLSVTHTQTQASLCEHASWPLTGDAGTLEPASKAAPCTCTAAQIEHRSEHSHGKRSVDTNQPGWERLSFSRLTTHRYIERGVGHSSSSSHPSALGAAGKGRGVAPAWRQRAA